MLLTPKKNRHRIVTIIVLRSRGLIESYNRRPGDLSGYAYGSGIVANTWRRV